MSMRVWKVGLVLAATVWLGSPDPAWAQRGRFGGGRVAGGGRVGGAGNWGGANWGGGAGGFQGSRGAGLPQGGATRSAAPRSGQLAGGQGSGAGQGSGSFAQRYSAGGAGAGLGRNTAAGVGAAGTVANGSGSARQNFAARHGQTSSASGANASARTAGTAASSAGSRTVVAAPGGAVASGSNGTFVRVGGFAIGVGSNGGFYLRLGRPFYGYGYGMRSYGYGYYPYAYSTGAVAPVGYSSSTPYGDPTQASDPAEDGTDPAAIPENGTPQSAVDRDVPELVETAVADADAGLTRIPRRSSDLDLNGDFARQGETAFKAGNYKKAARAWRHAVVDDPQNGTLVMMLGQALFAASSYDEAAGATQQGMLLLPEDKWNVVVGHYKELYTKIGDYTTQLRSLEDARKAKRDDPALRFLLGYHYGYLGFPDRAVKELDKGLELAAKDELAQKLRDHFAAQIK